MPDPYDECYPLWQAGRVAIFKPHEALRMVPATTLLARTLSVPFHFTISGMRNTTLVRKAQVLIAGQKLGDPRRERDVVLLWDGEVMDPDQEICTYFTTDNPDLGEFRV